MSLPLKIPHKSWNTYRNHTRQIETISHLADFSEGIQQGAIGTIQLKYKRKKKELFCD